MKTTHFCAEYSSVHQIVCVCGGGANDKDHRVQLRETTRRDTGDTEWSDHQGHFPEIRGKTP